MVYRKDWGQPQAGAQGFARTMKAYGRKVNLSIADLGTLGNVIGLFVLPANFVVLDWKGPAVPAFGTSLTFDIGVPATSNLFLSASNIGAAGGALPAMASTGPFYRTTTDTEVQLKVTAAVTAAAAAGILEFYIYGFIYQ